MTGKELKQIIDELREEGNSDEDILAGFYQMYKNGDFDLEDLEVAVAFVGYALKDEFKQMTEEERKKLDEEEFENIEIGNNTIEKERKIYKDETSIDPDNWNNYLEELLGIPLAFNTTKLAKSETDLPYDIYLFNDNVEKNFEPIILVDLGDKKIPMYIKDDAEIMKEVKEAGIMQFENMFFVQNFISGYYYMLINHFNGYLSNIDLFKKLNEDVKNHSKFDKFFTSTIDRKRRGLSELIGMELSIKEEIGVLTMLANTVPDDITIDDCLKAINGLKYHLTSNTVKLIKDTKDNLKKIVLEKREEDE